MPSGTVTFLFTDLDGSTRLWEQHPGAMKAALARHDEILREAIGRRDGHVVKTTGDGFHAVFTTAHDAIGAAAGAARPDERAVGGDGCVEGADGSPHRNCGAARR
jgi:class 3 adenylate cyclase